ncbi:MAG: LytR/AlgR family response regulator transcription factor [Longimicrobiales bacterium]
MIRTLIAEDEPLAARKLRDLIADEEDLELVGEAHDGLSAAAQIDAVKPDLVFLDVSMPIASGLDTLERIAHRPAVVFTTAYDQFALAAFELAAVDYLLKPFSQERFREAMSRVRRLLATPLAHSALERAQETLGRRPLTRLFVRDRDATRPLSLSSVERLEARDDYVAVHAAGRTYLLGIPLQKLEDRLDPDQFVRIHRSHIVNMDFITAIHAHDASRMLVELSDGTRVIASRSGSQRLRQLAQPGA